VLSPGGVAITTWFLFDKREFPMMQWFQNMLFVNEFDQTNAALFARAWLVDLPRQLGLRMTRIVRRRSAAFSGRSSSGRMPPAAARRSSGRPAAVRTRATSGRNSVPS
jgi:hypothetical protein